MDLHQLINYLDNILETSTYSDYAENGLQVESKNKEIKKIAVAVDCGVSIIEKAISNKADLLIVHHGLFWGGKSSITGALAKKVSLLLENGCSLYASHLPLDGHQTLGNAAQLAKFIGITQPVDPGFLHKNRFIGCIATFTPALDLNKIIEKTSNLDGVIDPVVYNFGRDVIGRAGIVTGSGTSFITEAAGMKLDLLISGEPKQEAYHLAKDLGFSVLFAGHYATETLGVKALAEELKSKYQLESCFIDEPTGV